MKTFLAPLYQSNPVAFTTLFWVFSFFSVAFVPCCYSPVRGLSFLTFPRSFPGPVYSTDLSDSSVSAHDDLTGLFYIRPLALRERRASGEFLFNLSTFESNHEGDRPQIPASSAPPQLTAHLHHFANQADWLPA